MRVRMMTQYANGDTTCSPGDEITVSDKEARQLIEGRFAVAVETQPGAAPPSAKGGGITIEPAEVAVLGLDPRVIEALAAHEPAITTIEQLIQWEQDHTFDEIKGIGASTSAVIENALAAYLEE